MRAINPDCVQQGQGQHTLQAANQTVATELHLNLKIRHNYYNVVFIKATVSVRLVQLNILVDSLRKMQATNSDCVQQGQGHQHPLQAAHRRPDPPKM